jgi:hypothetical protein
VLLTKSSNTNTFRRRETLGHTLRIFKKGRKKGRGADRRTLLRHAPVGKGDRRHITSIDAISHLPTVALRHI